MYSFEVIFVKIFFRKGDADLYVSDTNDHPTFDYDSHSMSGKIHTWFKINPIGNSCEKANTYVSQVY